MASMVDENWEVLVSAFPSGWQQFARETGAIKHQLKAFRSEGDLLRVLLLHVGKGYSLRETAVIAKAAGSADVSDVALLKRLRKSEPWLLRLCHTVLRETGIHTTDQHRSATTPGGWLDHQGAGQDGQSVAVAF